MNIRTPGRATLIAFSGSAIVLLAWALFVRSWNPPVERRIVRVALGRTGKWLAAGTSQGQIAVWNKGRPTPRHVSFRRGPLNDLQFSGDERVLAVASQDLGLYDPEKSAPPRLLRSDGRNYGTACFSENGETLLVITGTGTIEILEVHSGITQLEICCSTIYGEVAFTPDGRGIVNAGHWPTFWNARSGQLVARLTKKREFYTFGPIAFDGFRQVGDSPRRIVFLGSQDGRVYAWNLATRRLFAVSPPRPGYVEAITVTSGGWVAYAGSGSGLRLWNPWTGEERSVVGARPTSNLALGPDGSIFFGTADGAVQFWDIEARRRIRVVQAW